VSQAVAFSVNAGGSLVQNGGFETGSFSAWVLDGMSTLVPTDPFASPVLYNVVVNRASGYPTIHTGNYGAFLGDSDLATVSQTLGTYPGQSYLLSFWLINTRDGDDQQFLVRWIPNGDSTDPVYSAVSPGILDWTQVRIVVTASAPGTVLQFASQNSAFGFGLDDISVTPIPPVAFTSTAVNGTSIEFHWRATPGLGYKVQYKSTVDAADWTDLGTVVASGDSASLSDTVDSSVEGGRYYRLVLGP
jgi:hypothetical protein